MAKKELIDYIKKQISSGHDEENIRQHLVSFGHKVREIDTAIDEIKKPKPVQAPRGTVATIKKPLKEKDFGISDYLTVWVRVFVSPSAIFEKQKKLAKFPNSIAHLAIAGVFGGIIALLGAHPTTKIINIKKTAKIINFFILLTPH